MPISRRKFVKLGAHAAFGGLLVYTLRGIVLPQSTPRTVEAEGDSAYDRYRSEEHHWAFVIDTMKCIGCGRCARACKQENNVPWDPQCNRTWVERYSFTADGEVCVDSPAGGVNGFAPETTSEGARGFGDLRDPESTVSKILAERNVSVLKPEMGTKPKTYYLELDGEVV